MRRALLLVLLAAMPAFGESITEVLCSSEPPENAYGVPLCEEYEMNRCLTEAAEQGDASALALLQRRYAETQTYVERQRLARVLLGAVEDSAIWKEIYADAELAVRFAEVEEAELPPGFEEWCEKRGFDPFEHGIVIDRAFSVAADDPRAHELLLRALDSPERNIAFTAASRLAEQDDTGAIDGIQRVLERFNSYSFSLAAVIRDMSDPRAQALAKKYLGEDEEEEVQP